MLAATAQVAAAEIATVAVEGAAAETVAGIAAVPAVGAVAAKVVLEAVAATRRTPTREAVPNMALAAPTPTRGARRHL